MGDSLSPPFANIVSTAEILIALFISGAVLWLAVLAIIDFLSEFRLLRNENSYAETWRILECISFCGLVVILASMYFILLFTSELELGQSSLVAIIFVSIYIGMICFLRFCLVPYTAMFFIALTLIGSN